MKNIDKWKIQQRIEEIKRQIQKSQKPEKFRLGVKKHLADKKKLPQKSPLVTSAEKQNSEVNFFYVLEAKPLTISIIILLVLLFATYFLSLKTPYLTQLTNFISQFLS